MVARSLMSVTRVARCLSTQLVLVLLVVLLQLLVLLLLVVLLQLLVVVVAWAPARWAGPGQRCRSPTDA